MQQDMCPKCKYGVLGLRKGRLVCSQPKCGYIQFSPISFENDVVNYEGEKQVESRFTPGFNSNIQGFGVNMEFTGEGAEQLNKTNKKDSFVEESREASKLISRWCNNLKLSDRIQNLANIRFGQIWQIFFRRNQKMALTRKNLAAYSVFNAAFEEGEFYIENKLIKRAGIEENEWFKLKRELNKEMSSQNVFAPKQTPYHFAMRYCESKKIRAIEREAICRLLESFKTNQVVTGQKESTAAACAIWVILKRSSLYHSDERFQLSNISREFDGKSDNTVLKFYQKNVANIENTLGINFEGMLQTSGPKD